MPEHSRKTLMRFSRSSWLGEIIAGTLAGTGAGVVGTLLFPVLGGDPLLGAAAGAVTGLVGSALSYPLKWFWEGEEHEGKETVAADEGLNDLQVTRDSHHKKAR